MTCRFKGCGRPDVARGLCAGHYQQQRRGAALTPLREGPAKVKISMRVSPECAAAFAEDPAAGRAALEAWAAKHTK